MVTALYRAAALSSQKQNSWEGVPTVGDRTRVNQHQYLIQILKADGEWEKILHCIGKKVALEQYKLLREERPEEVIRLYNATLRKELLSGWEVSHE